MVTEKRVALRASAENRLKPRKSHAHKASATTKASSEAREEIASTRERILTSATRFFAEQGFASTSMPAIAKASGITAGAIYKHFKSKAELLFEVTRRAMASIPFFVQASQREHDAASLPSLAAAYTEPELKLLRQLSIEIHSAVTKDTKVKCVVSASNEVATEWASGLIKTAQSAGKLNPKLNPVLAAHAYGVFIMGLTHMETVAPHLIGDPEWHEFVSDRIAALLGLS
jgi:AcrR family transcriptional regulator